MILDILRAAEIRNASLGVSGILAYGPSVFAQLIEGSEYAVTILAKVIADDARHRILWSHLGPIARRVIAPTLPMGYVALHELCIPITGTDEGGDATREKIERILLEAVLEKYPSSHVDTRQGV